MKILPTSLLAAALWGFVTPLAANARQSSSPEAAPRPPAVPSEKEFGTAVEARVRQLIKDHNYPGFSLGVVCGNDLVWSAGIGVADRASGRPCTPATLYQIGSMTKMFTGLSLAIAVTNHEARLGDALSRYLPDCLVPPLTDSPEAKITLQHLATHTSGLPRYPASLVRADGDPILGFTESQLCQGLSLTVLERPIGARHSYSNFGYGVLATALSKATHQEFPSLVQSRICTPLGMTHTTFDALQDGGATVATPYRDDDPTVPTQPWRMGALSGAGGLFSNVQDMAKFVSFQLGANPTPLGPNGDEARRLQQTPFYRFAVSNDWAYGLGCFVVDPADGDGPIITHGGDVDGYCASVRLDLSRKIGIIYMSNCGMGNQDLADFERWFFEEAVKAFAVNP